MNEHRESLLRTIDAIYAENDALRAQLAERRVVVPDLTKEMRKELCEELDARWNSGDNFGRIVDRIWDHHQRLVATRVRTVADDEVVVGREEWAARKRHTNLLREVVEDLSKFDSPEMRRLAPRTVESIGEFVARADAALAALREGRG